MNEYIKSLEILESFRKLEKDWNGYNADPIPTESIDNALDFLDYLKENINDLIYPEIYPTAQDSVQFEWSGKNEEYLEFEFFPSKVDALLEIKSDSGSDKIYSEFIIPNKPIGLEYIKYFQKKYC
jgi:hypothetical protein